MKSLNKDIFRAYDIRGKYPSEVNEKAVAEIVSRFFSDKRHATKKVKIVIGHDARLSSPALYKSILKTLKANSYPPAGGLKTVAIGMATTPMFYFLVNDLKADYGIMVTASHNPKEYNGLKIVGERAAPITGTEVLEVIK